MCSSIFLMCSVKSSIATNFSVLISFNKIKIMPTEKELTPDKKADENPSKCDKETQTPGVKIVKMKSKLIQTSKIPTAGRSSQTNEKVFKEAEELFKATKKHASEEDKLKLVPSGDDTQSTLQADSSMQVAQQPQPSSQKDNSVARQLSTLNISGQSYTSPSKQESNLEDATATKSSCDKAYQKELCEQILKTDPLRGIGVSQIYFAQYCDDICSRLGELKLLEKSESEFLEINNDYERIRYILKFEKLINLELKIAKYNSKSEEFATALEEEYNNCCHSQEIDTLKHGLKLINRSIQFTPGADRKRLGIRLMKRAWIKKMLSKFVEAREDALRSLQFHLDHSDMWISLEVLGHCNFHIGKKKTAEGFFKQALDGLKQSNLDQETKAVAAKRIASVYKHARGEEDNEEPDKNITKDLTTPEVSYGINRTLKCATDAVEVKIKEKTGRGLYATKDIVPGDVIIVEKPYASVLNRGNFETHCNNCFKRFRSSIPCDTCSRVWFCSEECLKEAKAGFHSSECKVLHLLYDENVGRVPPLVFRTLLQLTWENIKSLRKSKKINPRLADSHPLHMGFDLGKKYSTDDYLTTYKLVTNAQKRNFGDLFRSTIMAFYLYECLKEVDFFKGENVSSEDELFVKSLILRHMQNFSCNLHNSAEFMFGGKYLGTIPIVYLGVSIHPTISLINHSCNPNVFKYSSGKNCIVRATNIIRKGEQLLDNYSNIFDTLGRDSRRSILKNQHMFYCTCIACEENWPIYNNNNVFMRLACPEEQCDQMVEYDGREKMLCPSCGFNKKHENMLKEVNRELGDFDRGMDLMKSGHIEEATDVIKKFQMYASKNFIPPTLCITLYQKFFKRCFFLQGNVFRSDVN
ncbi:UNVERIFIED_CONTAM: hypothetical protein RMT77_018832 [Armadillidium vulgare]